MSGDDAAAIHRLHIVNIDALGPELKDRCTPLYTGESEKTSSKSDLLYTKSFSGVYLSGNSRNVRV